MEQLHGQGRRALQGRGRFVEEQGQTWSHAVAKGAPSQPKLCCTAQSHITGLPLHHSCLNNDGSVRKSDPDLNIAGAREITVMLGKRLIAFTVEIWALFLA